MINIRLQLASLVFTFRIFNPCFHLHYAVLFVTNVNENAPLSHFYGFCNVTISEKTCSVIYGFDLSRT